LKPQKILPEIGNNSQSVPFDRANARLLPADNLVAIGYSEAQIWIYQRFHSYNSGWPKLARSFLPDKEQTDQNGDQEKNKSSRLRRKACKKEKGSQKEKS
jgi:hypothetical protein